MSSAARPEWLHGQSVSLVKRLNLLTLEIGKLKPRSWILLLCCISSTLGKFFHRVEKAMKLGISRETNEWLSLLDQAN